jgi:hypothetical protein
MNSKNIYQKVQDHYGSASRGTTAGYSQSVAMSFGYTDEELQSIPTEANLGLSCGNPLAIASIRPVTTLSILTT